MLSKIINFGFAFLNGGIYLTNKHQYNKLEQKIALLKQKKQLYEFADLFQQYS